MRLVPVAVIAAIFAGAVGLSGAASAPPDFEALPLAKPGTLSGRIVFLSTFEGCGRRVYDLVTGSNRPYAPDVCGGGGFVGISPDGRIVAVRSGVFQQQVFVVHPDGRRIAIGSSATGRGSPDTYTPEAQFAPDSGRVAICDRIRGAVVTLVADVRSGRVLERQPGTCEFAFTARGLAIVRDGRVLLGGKVLLRTRRSSGDTQIGLPLDVAANPAGTRLVVTTRDYVPGKTADRVRMVVMGLDGHVLGAYAGRVPFELDPTQLGPHGRSMVADGTAILMRFEGRSARLVYPDLDNRPSLSRVSFSPEGRFAVAGRYVYSEPPSPPPAQPDAVVFAADTFKPLYRIPLAAEALAAWIP